MAQRDQTTQEVHASAGSGDAPRVAVVGFGPIGQALARSWLAAGYPVVIGGRDPDRLATLTAGLPGVRCAHWTDAVAGSDVVALAVPHDALDDVVAAWRPEWAGKVVIDPANPIEVSADGRLVCGLPGPGTVGSHHAERLPGARVVRAFTHVMDELLASRGRRQPGVWAVAVAGDDEPAKKLVSRLVEATGFVPVDLGGLADSAPLDPGGALFPNMFTVTEMRLRLDAEAARQPRSGPVPARS